MATFCAESDDTLAGPCSHVDQIKDLPDDQLVKIAGADDWHMRAHALMVWQQNIQKRFDGKTTEHRQTALRRLGRRKLDLYYKVIVDNLLRHRDVTARAACVNLFDWLIAVPHAQQHSGGPWTLINEGVKLTDPYLIFSTNISSVDATDNCLAIERGNCEDLCTCTSCVQGGMLSDRGIPNYLPQDWEST
eukprot:TRINITY_DN13484_c0_g1_i1.p2 TRINITY_DN13484_c0_g1~~TRINITY_DN13484_c0_g1_i1.p2  ORF type:complete len:190 (-),score=10.44 TRINITY_DN13484_c0_g1_i1:549-1118(-)